MMGSSVPCLLCYLQTAESKVTKQYQYATIRLIKYPVSYEMMTPKQQSWPLQQEMPVVASDINYKIMFKTIGIFFLFSLPFSHSPYIP